LIDIPLLIPSQSPSRGAVQAPAPATPMVKKPINLEEWWKLRPSSSGSHEKEPANLKAFMNLMEKAQKKKRVIKMMRKADEEYEKAMKAFILVSNEAKNDNDSK